MRDRGILGGRQGGTRDRGILRGMQGVLEKLGKNKRDPGMIIEVQRNQGKIRETPGLVQNFREIRKK